MSDNYTTFVQVGRYYVGVFTINGHKYTCKQKRSKMGIAVKDAAATRRTIIEKSAK